jgi:hypothetical protein
MKERKKPYSPEFRVQMIGGSQIKATLNKSTRLLFERYRRY